MYECKMCGEQLSTAGGLLFSPPYDSKLPDFVKKKHLCVYCYDKVDDFIVASRAVLGNK